MLSTDLSSQPESFSQPKRLIPSVINCGIVVFYVLFTLLPNSNSLMVKWPWVFLWQMGLMLGPILLLFQLWHGAFRRLGDRLDWLAIAGVISLILSASFAEFTHQALWYTWAALCSLSFLYVLNAWLTSAERIRHLLIFQGLLSTVFSAYSLASWWLHTVMPQLAVLEQLKAYGIERRFDLTELTLRNWHPIGHQNYVAGYLILALPLLIGLAFSSKGRIRVAWIISFALSLATLHSTASRGSLLGLATSIFVFIVIAIRSYPHSRYPKLKKQLLSTGLLSILVIVLWGMSSDRIRASITSILTIEHTANPSYRAITNATGWFMGLDHPIFGAGLGSVTLLYQKYRPTWANGTESELTYQLHSTPAQLWAELGLMGVGLTLLTIVAITVLGLRCCNFQQLSHPSMPLSIPPSILPLSLPIGLVSGLAGYSVYAITDYQLDNLCISGTITIFIAVLIATDRLAAKRSASANRSVTDTITDTIATSLSFKRTTLIVTGFIVAVSIWLYPIHRAWMLSNQGFLALQQEDVSSFVAYLEKAHDLAPWEPYYPYQLGWNLGELAFQSSDIEQQSILAQESVKWFEKAIALSPNREFGYSNLGWLLVNTEPEKATEAFLKAAELVPDKRGTYFALGYSLLKAGRFDLATQSMVIELMQQPIFLTSPIWRSAELSAIYPTVLEALESTILKHISSDNFIEDENAVNSRRWQQLLGMTYWWQGDHAQAHEVFSQRPNELNQSLVTLASTSTSAVSENTVSENAISENAISDKTLVDSNEIIAAWRQILNNETAFISAMIARNPHITYINEDYYTKLLSDIQASIDPSSNFHQWLTQLAPSHPRRKQRLGFGTISRHIDGPLPKDFSVDSENIWVTHFLTSAFPRTMPRNDTQVLINALTDAVLAKS